VADPIVAPVGGGAVDTVSIANRQPMIGADATAPASRDRFELNGFIRVAGRPGWRRIPPGRVRDGRLHRGVLLAAALRRVMITAEAGRMTSRIRESRVPKYGRFLAFPDKG
jgi:hypothetical protein